MDLASSGDLFSSVPAGMVVLEEDSDTLDDWPNLGDVESEEEDEAA